MSKQKVNIILVLQMFLSFRAIQKNNVVREVHQEKLRLCVFMKHMEHRKKRAIRTIMRVKFEVMILCAFQNLLKKQWEFVGKLRTRSDGVEK